MTNHNEEIWQSPGSDNWCRSCPNPKCKSTITHKGVYARVSASCSNKRKTKCRSCAGKQWHASRVPKDTEKSTRKELAFMAVYSAVDDLNKAMSVLAGVI